MIIVFYEQHNYLFSTRLKIKMPCLKCIEC